MERAVRAGISPILTRPHFITQVAPFPSRTAGPWIAPDRLAAALPTALGAALF